MFNRILFLCIIIFQFGCDASSSLNQSSTNNLLESKYVEDEVIVALKKSKISSFSKMSQSSMTKVFRVKNVTSLGMSNRFLKLNLNEDEKINSAIQRLKDQDGIEFVQPNFIYSATAIPNDTHYGRLWGLRNNGQTITTVNTAQDSLINTNNPGTAGNDISAESAWNIITDCSRVVVAVLDTGAKLDHEDLVNNFWRSPLGGYKGYDAVDSDNFPDDLIHGHGTHVATTIAAEGNNSKGSTGICWKAKIMPVRVLNNQGAGTTAQIIAGISYAKAYGAKVINMSLGGGGSIDFAYLGAIGDADDILFVVAAGNDGTNNTTTPKYPCNFSTILPNVICVGAVDQEFNLTSYSNYSSTAVQISAPGTNILGGSPSQETKIIETFSSGWTGDSANWAWSASPSSLVNPTNYDGSSNQYANNLRSYVAKTYNFSTATSVLLEMDITHFLEKNADYLRIGFDRGAGANIFDNPTASFKEILPLTGGGVSLYHKSNDLDNPSTAVDISSPCAGQTNCTIGFQLQTDGLIRDYGVRISNMKVTAVTLATDSYKIIAGTSMATPHVTGVAAMVWAYNPQYTMAAVKNAILNGGKLITSLSGKTSTSRVLSAMGSLAYISKPATPAVSIK